VTTWLAVGDETGNWDALDQDGPADRRQVGASLTLAPLEAWAALDQESIGTQRAADRLGSPLQDLPASYPRKDFHHVGDAFDYLKQQKDRKSVV
jgi:hypothetical protein